MTSYSKRGDRVATSLSRLHTYDEKKKRRKKKEIRYNNSDGSSSSSDLSAPTHSQEVKMQPARPVPVPERVIGHNHVRRTLRDIKADQKHRRRQPSRWRRKLRYRMINSRRLRFGAVVFLTVSAVLALTLLWWFGELVAGLAVAGSAILFGSLVCGLAEILVHCPKLTEGLLFHLGVLERVYTSDLPAENTFTFDVDEIYGRDGRGGVGQGPAAPVSGHMTYHIYSDGEEYGDDGDDDDDDPDTARYYYTDQARPQWGDVAPQVHAPKEQLKRFVRRTGAFLGNMVSSPTQDDIDIQLELQAMQMAESRIYGSDDDDGDDGDDADDNADDIEYGLSQREDVSMTSSFSNEVQQQQQQYSYKEEEEGEGEGRGGVLVSKAVIIHEEDRQSIEGEEEEGADDSKVD